MMIPEYIKLAIISAMIVFILYIPFFLILKQKNIGITRQLSYLALLFSVLFIIFLTLILFNIPLDFKPDQYVFSPIPFERFIEKDLNIFKTIFTEILPNIIIFMPLGLFIPVVFKKMRKLYKTTIGVFFFTFSIEFFQYFIGRKADIDDIIANLLGGIIGYVIFSGLNHLFQNKKIWRKFIGEF